MEFELYFLAIPSYSLEPWCCAHIEYYYLYLIRCGTPAFTRSLLLSSRSDREVYGLVSILYSVFDRHCHRNSMINLWDYISGIMYVNSRTVKRPYYLYTKMPNIEIYVAHKSESVSTKVIWWRYGKWFRRLEAPNWAESRWRSNKMSIVLQGSVIGRSYP